MTSNSLLRELHFERLARKGVYQENKKATSFSCPVCYTDGSATGLVIPSCCSHKICLMCYSNMLLRNKSKACCPECRAKYLKSEDIIEDSLDDDYLDMPPLIPINDSGRENFTDLFNQLDLEQRISVLYVQLTREFLIQNSPSEADPSG
jgi:hypothetical protein